MSDQPIPQPHPGEPDIPVTPEGCAHAGVPQYQTGARKYHEDLCQPVAMLPTLRFPSEYPADNDNWRPGRFEPRSITPIRAVDWTPPNPTQSKCRHHYGYVTMSKQGRMQPYHASEPQTVKGVYEYPNLRRNHRMQVCRLETIDPEGIIPLGRFFYRGSYQAPRWADMHVHSLRVFYGTPI